MKLNLEFNPETGDVRANIKLRDYEIPMTANHAVAIKDLFDTLGAWVIDHCSEIFQDEEVMPEVSIITRLFVQGEDFTDEDECDGHEHPTEKNSFEMTEKKETPMPKYMDSGMVGEIFNLDGENA